MITSFRRRLATLLATSGPAAALRRFAAGTTLLVVLLVAGPPAGLAVDAASEQSVKAAYLYRLAEYVEWPDGAFAGQDAPLTIGVAGDRALTDELREMTRGRTLRGRRIRVMNIAARESLQTVHVLFIRAAAMGLAGQLVPLARTASTLVVTEVEDGLAEGAVINFRTVDQRVRFDVSLDAADLSGLRLNARLLAVAERVEPRTRR